MISRESAFEYGRLTRAANQEWFVTSVAHVGGPIVTRSTNGRVIAKYPPKPAPTEADRKVHNAIRKLK